MILELRHLTKSYGSNPVLRDVSLSLDSGEIMGLLGENGAGKSTLFKCVCGMTRRDSGEVIFDGRPIPVHFHERAARDAGIGMIPQESMLVPSLTAAENIFLGRELTRFGVLDQREMNRRSRELFDLFEVAIDPAAPCGTLNPGLRQFVEIARALAWECKLLILDEPTTVLAPHEVAGFFEVVRRVADRGAGVMIVSHKLEEVRSLCSSIAILRDGELVHRGAATISTREMASLMVGRDFANVFPPPENQPGETLFEARHLCAGLLDDISFEVGAGEILGVAGLMGSGRSFLAESIFGLHRIRSGMMTLAGKKYAPRSPAEAMRNKVAFLSEDRQRTGLFTDFSIADNMVMNRLEAYAGIFLRPGAIRARACEMERLFSIRMTSPDAPVRTLSGGNQQKTALAKAAETAPELFLFDEPTRGVDVGARSEIYKLIRGMAARNMGCLLISSDLEELLGMSDRIMVMRQGRIAGFLQGEAMNEEAVNHLAFGVNS